MFGIGPWGIFPRGRNAQLHFTALENIICCSLYFHGAPDAALCIKNKQKILH